MKKIIIASAAIGATVLGAGACGSQASTGSIPVNQVKSYGAQVSDGPNAGAMSAAPAPSPAPKPAPTVIARYSGTSNWNSPPFTIIGGSPALTVTYSYNSNDGSNFIADLKSSTDDQSIANDIGTAASRTTTLYPDTSGGNQYHLSITATGNWSITITEAP